MQHTDAQVRVGVGISRDAGRHRHPVDVDEGVDDPVALLVVQQGLQSLGHTHVPAPGVGQTQAEEGDGVGAKLLDGLDEGPDVRGVVLQPVAAREGDPDGGTVGVQVVLVIGQAREQAVTRMPDSLGGGTDDLGDGHVPIRHPVDENS